MSQPMFHEEPSSGVLTDEQREAYIRRCMAKVLDESINIHMRRAYWHAYTILHSCRSAEFVRQMEIAKGIHLSRGK